MKSAVNPVDSKASVPANPCTLAMSKPAAGSRRRQLEVRQLDVLEVKTSLPEPTCAPSICEATLRQARRCITSALGKPAGSGLWQVLVMRTWDLSPEGRATLLDLAARTSPVSEQELTAHLDRLVEGWTETYGRVFSQALDMFSQTPDVVDDTTRMTHQMALGQVFLTQPKSELAAFVEDCTPLQHHKNVVMMLQKAARIDTPERRRAFVHALALPDSDSDDESPPRPPKKQRCETPTADGAKHIPEDRVPAETSGLMSERPAPPRHIELSAAVQRPKALSCAVGQPLSKSPTSPACDTALTPKKDADALGKSSASPSVDGSRACAVGASDASVAIQSKIQIAAYRRRSESLQAECNRLQVLRSRPNAKTTLAVMDYIQRYPADSGAMHAYLNLFRRHSWMPFTAWQGEAMLCALLSSPIMEDLDEAERLHQRMISRGFMPSDIRTERLGEAIAKRQSAQQLANAFLKDVIHSPHSAPSLPSCL